MFQFVCLILSPPPSLLIHTYCVIALYICLIWLLSDCLKSLLNMLLRDCLISLLSLSMCDCPDPPTCYVIA